MSTKFPTPETKRAYLVPEGSARRVATIHHYFETRPLGESRDAEGNHVLEYEYLFRCFRDGTVRRWGTCVVEVPPPSSSDEPSMLIGLTPPRTMASM